MEDTASNANEIINQGESSQEAPHSDIAVLQRLRHVSRQIWQRSRFGTAVGDSWRLFLRRLGKRSKQTTAAQNQGTIGYENR